MINKKSVISIAVLIAVVAVLISLYFKYWHEPKSMYVQTNSPKLAQIRKDLDKYIADLKEKGLYDCCIRNDCKWCAIYLGYCPCGKLISQEKPEKSCPECAAAWNRKQGKIPGVDPDAIEVTTFGIYGYESGILKATE